jgi:hypothetical protein
MADLPKFVRARLAAQPAGNDHPDADLLSAFAENSLLDHERERVMAHLAACPDCREVLALVAPAEGPPVPVASQERRPWLTLALLRWAAIPATAAVIAGAVLLHTRSERSAIVPRSTTATQTSQPAASPAPPQVAPEPPASQAPGLQAKEKPRSAMPARAAAAERVAPKSMAKASGRAETAVVAEAKPPAPPKGDVEQTFAARPGAALASPSAIDRDRLSAESDRTRSNTAVVAMAPSPAPPPSTPSAADTTQAGANRPAMARNMKKQAMSGAMAAAPMRDSTAPGVGGGVGGSYAVAGVPAELRISPEGKVERRLDANAPWQSIRIDDSVTFRAVARIGNEIWLGGNGGVLYHSGNAGATWHRMATPTVEDITGIAFNNRREGALTTAGGQRFTTHDAGATWAKAKE